MVLHGLQSRGKSETSQSYAEKSWLVCMITPCLDLFTADTAQRLADAAASAENISCHKVKGIGGCECPLFVKIKRM